MKDLEKISDFLFYSAPDGSIKIQIILGDETVWATQKSMGDIFGVESNTITYHLGEIFKSGELQEDSVTRKIRATAKDGKSYLTNFYNLDVIIAVGYRVNSYNATQFRIWATKVLKEYLIKGFALDDERLKQGNNLFNKDYFEELLIRIKEIRTSERRFYQKITDIYARCSSDYDVNSPITKKFFATVQNKLEFAITHKTAPEIIKSRANYQAQYMGLNTWKNSPHGRILKTDVSVAKNYLSKKEIDDLNHIVVMYLDYAELQARNHRLMKMQDWVNKLDAFLQFNEFDILKDAGRVKAIVAKSFAEKEFEKYKAIHYLEEEKSDFDKVVEQIKQTGSLPPSAPDQNQETIFSTFNQNLITAVNFNPKDKAE
jgi:hypothetical protein